MPCKVYQIGVFFDGTGNSKEERATYSNVAKLYEKYRVLKSHKEDTLHKGKEVTSNKLYITGIGTAQEGKAGYMQEEDNAGTGYYAGYKDEGAAELAAGGGGAKRIYDAIERVCALLDAHPYDASDPEKYKTRLIDVFGFSRGAAEARDFVNTFIKEKINLRKQYQDVRFNFIGIFDTVGSFGVAGNAIDMKPKKAYVDDVSESDGLLKGLWEGGDDHVGDRRYEPYNFNLAMQSAKHMVHLIAADEVRKNFPLTNAQGSGAKEIICLGVHSDVGGGYAPHETEMLVAPVAILNRSTAQQMQTQGWMHNPYTKTLQISRKRNNRLSEATLYLMYHHAKRYDVPFEQIKAPGDAVLKAYSDFLLKSPSATNYTHAEEIRQDYAHQSATHPSVTSYYPHILRVPSTLPEGTMHIKSNLANLQNGRVTRAVYPNHSGKAVVPTGD